MRFCIRKRLKNFIRILFWKMRNHEYKRKEQEFYDEITINLFKSKGFEDIVDIFKSCDEEDIAREIEKVIENTINLIEHIE